MGANPREGAEQYTYKLKYLTQVWLEQWKDQKHLEEGLVDF